MIIDIYIHFMDASYGPELFSRGLLKFSPDWAVIEVKVISSVFYIMVGDIEGQIRNIDEAGSDRKVTFTH